MARALLPLHRRFLAAGVMLMVHTEWRLRECYAMRRGAAAALDESERSDTPLARLDAWVLQNMLLHVSLGCDHVIKTILPTHLTMIERRLPKVRKILAEAPSADLA